LGVQFARSIGIAIDHRRKNKSQESLDRNKARLLKYINSLVLFPLNAKNPVTKAKAGILNDTPKDNQKVNADAVVNTLPPLIKRVKPIGAALLDSLKKNKVFRSLRQEWNNKEMKVKDLKKLNKLKKRNNDGLFKYIFPILYMKIMYTLVLINFYQSNIDWLNC
jgi:large subunit ribosomal protein L13e